MTDSENGPIGEDGSIESLKMFENLGRIALQDIAGSIQWIHVDKGQTLFRQGDAADAMYMVRDGMLHAYLENERCGSTLVGEMGPGSLVGEIALLMGGRRSATVVAAERTTLGRLGAAEADAIIARNPEMKNGILDIIRKRLRRTQWLKLLPAYFGEIDREKYVLIEPRFEWVHLPRGEVLFAAGDAADCLYFLVHGLLHVVSRDASGTEEAIGAIFRGEVVGEMAILSGEKRTATVRAVRDSDLVRLTKTGFDEINRVYPGATMAILMTIVNRLRERGRTPRRSTAVTIALVPAGQQVPLAEFARRLHVALSCTDRAALLNSEAVAAEFASTAGIAQATDDNPRHLGLLTWMEELETNNDFVIYQADLEPTPWTQRCIRQADQVLIIGRAGDEPAAGRIEKEWLREDTGITAAAQTLVLIHGEDAALPSGTRQWLEGRRLTGCQHLRWSREEDFSRLARVLSKRSIGLVLGGGGARGMAHLGVLRALEERGIPVDMIGGASIGSIVGGAYAMGMGTERLMSLCKDSFQKKNPFNDYTVPVISVLRSRKIDQAARDAFGDVRIEDLWLSFFCVSCNLASCDVKVHDSGPLWAAARTSSSLPGIMVPILHDGVVHVDGGVMNNLPGDIMRRRAGLVITVDVDSRETMKIGLAVFPSQWKVLWSRLRPGKKRSPLPTVADIMMATIMTGCRKSADAAKADADLSLEPPVQGIGILDFKSLEKTAEEGYLYTRDILDRLPADSPLRRYFNATKA
jgi:predicted acylesterase/phospholipase RssA/CRP-like cAMP-binding protein